MIMNDGSLLTDIILLSEERNQIIVLKYRLSSLFEYSTQAHVVAAIGYMIAFLYIRFDLVPPHPAYIAANSIPGRSYYSAQCKICKPYTIM
jgi:hypothetical protein